jgi:hypothetical protein
MDVSFEQVINDHLELKKRNAALDPRQERGNGADGAAEEADELRTLEDATSEEPQEGGGDLWAAARDFEWGE